jgi:hypothetical protein
MQRIRDSLIFENVIVWDNSAEEHDYKVAGRYAATLLAETKAVYYQDDDCLIPESTQQALLDEYEPGVMVANWGHGENPDGYEDAPLVHGGAIVDTRAPVACAPPVPRALPDGRSVPVRGRLRRRRPVRKFRYVWLKFDIDMAIAQHPVASVRIRSGSGI